MAEPFGTTAPETNPQSLGAFTQNLRLQGQYADQESGLFYNMNRQLDTSINRYTQSDPTGLAGGSYSPYAYADNNPISNVDPNGLRWARYVPAGGCHWVPDPPINPDYPSTPAPAPNFTPANPSVLCQMFPLACAAAILPYVLPKEECPPTAGFCSKRKDYCLAFCQYELDMPGRRDNTGPFRACVRRCMNAVGCNY